MTKEIMREGEDSAEAVTSRTAAENESHAQEARPIADIDRQIAALQEERRLAARRACPTVEEFVRLPWVHAGAGVIRSASRACVVLIADSDFASDDWAEKNACRERLARMVLAGVNSHEALRDELDALCQAVEVHRAGALTGDGLWHYVVKAREAVAKAEGAHLMALRHTALQPLASRLIPGGRGLELPRAQLQERTLYVHPTDARALVEPTRDGHDYRRVCARHQWCSDVVPFFADLGECPSCLVEIDSVEGRKRYAVLHGEHVRIIGTV